MVTSDVPRLREMLSQLRESVLADKLTLNTFVDSSVKNAADTLASFYDKLCKEHEEASALIKAEHASEVGELNAKIDDLTKNNKELLKEVSNLKNKLQMTVTDLEKFKTDSEQMCKEMKEKYEEEREDLIRKHTLELEVELDKIQSDYKTSLDQQETQVRELMEKLAEADDKVKQSKAEKEQNLLELKAKSEQDSKELRDTLAEEFKQREKEKIEEVRQQIVKANDEKIEELVQEHEKKLRDETVRLCQEKEQALLEQKDELDIVSKTYVSNMTDKMNCERAEELKQLGEQLEREHTQKIAVLEKEHEEKVTGLKNAFIIERTELEQQVKLLERSEMSSTESQTESQEVLSVSQHKRELEAKERLLKDEMDKALLEQKETHEKELQNLVQRLEKQKEDSLSMKTSIAAERQVQFNEAVSRVSQEKDKVIEEMKQKVQEQTDNFETVCVEKEKLEKKIENIQTEMEEKDQQHKQRERHLQNEMSLLQQNLTQLQQQILAKSEISVTPPEVKEGPSLVAIDSKTSELENTLKSKEEEIGKLQQRVMELSMSASTRSIAQDKVSITSCNVGDLVLLCLDERHDQYVVFTIGTTLHFLHTECLDPLGLKTGPGETRKSWVLAEIMDKEYCQAKKPQNRFKVPVGTKFYRVKAKPWSRETTRKDSSSPSKSSQASAAV